MTEREIVVWGVGTPRTLRVHWALHELQLPYETRPVQPRTPMMEEADFLSVSPGKKVPALQHGDLTLTESAAITRYLMDNFSGQTWSVEERTTMDRFVFFTLMGARCHGVVRHSPPRRIAGDLRAMHQPR